MKRLLLLLFVISKCFTACDGKHRALETTEERLEKSNLTTSSIEVDEFIPEQPIAIVTDTIINSEISVSIKYYSTPDAIKQNSSKSEQAVTKVNAYFREFQSEINVYKDNKKLFTEVLNKKDFSNTDQTFLRNAIMQYVWLDEFESADDNYVLHCSFLSTENDSYKYFKIYFDNSGNKNIELIQTS